MSEKVIIRQNNKLQVEFLVSDPHQPKSDSMEPVMHIHQMSPYTLMLAGLGSCTTSILHTYAHHHELDLQNVEIRLQYNRDFKEDCENCEGIERYEENIEQELAFEGDLTPAEREKLFKIAFQCPIHKMMEHGVEIPTTMSEPVAG